MSKNRNAYHGYQDGSSYCHAQAILVDRFGSSSEYLWYPYSTRKARRLARLMRTLWGTPLGRWLS